MTRAEVFDGGYQAGRNEDRSVLVGLRPVGLEVDQAFIQVDVSRPGADKLTDSGVGNCYDHRKMFRY